MPPGAGLAAARAAVWKGAAALATATIGKGRERPDGPKVRLEALKGHEKVWRNLKQQIFKETWNLVSLEDIHLNRNIARRIVRESSLASLPPAPRAWFSLSLQKPGVSSEGSLAIATGYLVVLSCSLSVLGMQASHRL